MRTKQFKVFGLVIDRSYKTRIVFRNLRRDSKNEKPKVSQEDFPHYLVMFRKTWNSQLEKLIKIYS